MMSVSGENKNTENNKIEKQESKDYHLFAHLSIRKEYVCYKHDCPEKMDNIQNFHKLGLNPNNQNKKYNKQKRFYNPLYDSSNNNAKIIIK